MSSRRGARCICAASSTLPVASAVLSLAECLAGLGLLIIGLRLMSSQLQHATGHRIRRLLKAATRTTLAGLSAGTLAGAITQSSNAVAVIAGNLVRARLLTTRDAIPIVAGGNVGTSALVLLAAVDFHLAVLFLIGMVGVGFQFGLDRRSTSRRWMSVLFGLTLVFLGIDFIKSAPRTLDIAALSGVISGWPDAGLLGLGLLAALLTQSSSTATIVILAAMKAGLVDLDGCFYAIVGANLGSGLATLIASGGLRGVGRQLCVVHIMVKGLGSGLLLAGYLAAPEAGLDPVALFARLGGGSAATSVSMLFLLLQSVGALPVAIFRTPVARLARRFSPPTLEDDVSQPRFVDPGAVGDPAGALELVQAEIADLTGRLPGLLPDFDRPGHPDGRTIAVLARGSRAVASTTDAFIVELITHGLSGRDLDAALASQTRLETLQALQETLAEFSTLVLALQPRPTLAFNLSESLRLLVMQLPEAGDDAEELAMLIAMTGDRGEYLDRMRRSLVASAFGAEGDVQRLLLATSRFERAVWLIHRLAIAIRPEGVAMPVSEASAIPDPPGGIAALRESA